MKKFFISLLVLSCFFLLLFGNVSFATLDLTNFQEYNYNGNRIDFTNSLFENFLNKNLSNYRDALYQSNQTSLTRFDTFITSFNDTTTYPCIYWYTEKNSNNFNDIALHLHLSNSDFTTTARYSFYKLKSQSNYSITLSSATGGENINGTLSTTYANKYVLYNNKYYVATNSPYTPPNIVKFLTYNNIKTNTIEIHYNGNVANFIKADYSDTVSSWRLGYFTNFNDSEVDEIYGYLYGFAGSSNQGVIYSDLVASFQWKKGVGTYTNNLYFPDNSDHAVFVNPQVITQYQGYALIFNAFINREEQEVINNTTYLYFVPYGSSATSGDLISPDFNSGLDWNFINSIEHLYDSPSGNTDYIYNSNFNSSGDNIFGITYNDFDNWGFGDFVISSVAGFYNAFTNYDNLSLNFGYLGDINSSQFVTPDNTLFQFIGLISNSFLILSCVGFFYYTILDISTFNIDGLVKDREDLGMF